MLTNIKSESNAPFLKSPPLVHKIIFFEKKSTSSSKMGFSIEYSLHKQTNQSNMILPAIQSYSLNMNDDCRYN